MSLSASWTDIDLLASGRQVGSIRVEHSVHRSAYGTIPVPIAVFANGTGPTVLLMAGSHGDEYEGQLTLTKLIRTLDIARVQGRVIVLPAANQPAVLAGTRTSPLDQGNLNRCFGDVFSDTPSGQIAAFISEVILAQCDVFFDIHSGGSSLQHLSCSYADLGTDKDMAEKTLAALEAMNAPLSWAQSGCPNGPVGGRAAVRAGVMHLSGEFGGGGLLNASDFHIAERCVYRLLDHLGIYPLDEKWNDTCETKFIENHQGHYVYAPSDGVLESSVVLGDDVEAGQIAGYLHRPEFPLQEPTPLYFTSPGIVACIRAMGRTRQGDCLFQQLSEIPRADVIEIVEQLT